MTEGEERLNQAHYEEPEEVPACCLTCEHTIFDGELHEMWCKKNKHMVSWRGKCDHYKYY